MKSDIDMEKKIRVFLKRAGVQPGALVKKFDFYPAVVDAAIQGDFESADRIIREAAFSAEQRLSHAAIMSIETNVRAWKKVFIKKLSDDLSNLQTRVNDYVARAANS